MFLRRRPAFSGSLSQQEPAESIEARRPELPRTPVYSASPVAERRVVTKTLGDRLVVVMKSGRFVAAEALLGVATADECVLGLSELLDRGYVVQRVGRHFRLRPRGDSEPRQSLPDVVGRVFSLVGGERERVREPGLAREVSAPVDQVGEPSEDDGGGEAAGAGGVVLSEPRSALTLPLDDCASMVGAILARRGSGKTYLGMVLVEELLAKAERPAVVVIDPPGVWWGLLATAEGRPLGDVLLLGGPRGHAGLRATDGCKVAQIISSMRERPVVIDLSDLAPVEQHELVADLANSLMTGERFPTHVVIDECDEFVPQSFGAVGGQRRRARDAVERMVMRGRVRGIGVTLLSLRPAVVSKNVLSQVDHLWLGRMMEPNDIRAVRSWLESFENQVSDDQRVECLSQLPVLSRGIFYFLRGGDAPMFRRFRCRRKHTYDSSMTLVAGVKNEATLSSPKSEVVAEVAEILAGTEMSGEGGE